MTDALTSDRLPELLRLAEQLSDQVLAAQFMGRPIRSDQLLALTKAARLLHDRDLEWPPLLAQALEAVAETAERPAPQADGEPLPDVDAGGLIGFFSKLRISRP